jgi:serpin B
MDGVQVWLPRFGVSSQPDFTKSLQGLGIKRLFLMGQCQFKTTGMPLYDKNPDLAIMPSKMSNMSQQAWIDVDEKGTEAYVAGINCGEILASDGAAEASRTPKPVIFRADHPFLFIVRHVDTGAIVFMGRLMNP